MIGVDATTKVICVRQIPYRFLSAWRKLKVHYQKVFKEQYGNIFIKKPVIFMLAETITQIRWNIVSKADFQQLFSSKMRAKENLMSTEFYHNCS